jgi:predicted phosphodiesterase
MRLAIISDIHGNMDALDEVLLDSEKSGVDGILCLGDLVGYGPEPEAVIQTIRDRKIPTLMGNHELSILDPKYLSWFNPLARESIHKTIPMLSKASLDFIAGLKTAATKSDARFVHGFPPDSVITYLFQIEEPAFGSVFEDMKEKLCFVGHTHKLEFVSYRKGTVIRAPLIKGVMQLREEKQYIINVGSVGQPRDGNNNAKYTIWDTTNNLVQVRFIPYHIARVTNKIIEAGLPDAHAERLW